jgi:Domain of unknown function (DUF309)
VSRKSPRIAERIAGLSGGGWDAHYLGYFDCFNRQEFYEAHDVLEELWLAGGRSASNYAFHKGLIQLAGAFVHLQKDRLQPAVALFNLADNNLRQYPALHDGVDLTVVLVLIDDWRGRVGKDPSAPNPLRSGPPPRLDPPSKAFP